MDVCTCLGIFDWSIGHSSSSYEKTATGVNNVSYDFDCLAVLSLHLTFSLHSLYLHDLNPKVFAGAGDSGSRTLPANTLRILYEMLSYIELWNMSGTINLMVLDRSTMS